MYWLWPVHVTHRLLVCRYNSKRMVTTAGKRDILCIRVVIENVTMWLAGQLADKWTLITMRISLGYPNYIRGSGWLCRYSDSLQAGRSGDRIPVEAKFSAHVKTGPGAHPASYTMGTGSLLGVKRPGRGVDPPPPPSSVEVEGRVELYIRSPSGPSWPVLEWILPF